MWQLARKFLLTGVFSFVAPGSYAQLYFGILLSLGSLVLLSMFTPYVDPKLDVLQSVCQVSCVITLLCAIILKALADGEEPLFLDFVNVVSVAFQMIPFAVMLGLVLYVSNDVYAMARAATRRAKLMPAALRDEDPNPLPPPAKRRLYNRWAARLHGPSRPVATSQPNFGQEPAIHVTP